MLAVLLLAAFVAAAVSGAAGFGGALLLLPMLTIAVGPTQAVPLLTFAQLVGNLSRVVLGFRSICWRALALFLSTALPFALAGSFSFISLPPGLLARAIGLLLVLFAFLRRRGGLRLRRRGWTLALGGALVGFLSGLAGSAGPLGAAVFQTLDLSPLAYIASEAASALAIHAAKLVVYQQYIPMEPRFWRLALALSAAMVAGTWASRRLLTRVSPDRFRAFVTLLLAAIGLYMLLTGSR